MSNPIFKLDLLECNYLKKKARFNKTGSILKSKKQHKLIPLDLDADEANRQIIAVKGNIFDNKFHNSVIKYQRELKKLIKPSSKTSKKLDDNEIKFLKDLDIEKISKIRVIKLLTKIYNPNLINRNPSEYKFINELVLNALLDKSNELNPSFHYNQLSNDEKNWYSKLMNNKNFKSVNETIESSFKLINGVIDKKKKSDKEVLESEEKSLGSKNDEYSGSESDEDDEDSDSNNDSETETARPIGSDIDDDDLDNIYNEYDNLVAGSDDDDDDAGVRLSENIDYNEVTDSELSDEEDDDEQSEEESESEDDFFEEDTKPKSKSKKDKKTKESKKIEKEYNLPKLMDGYLSASDDEEADNDEVVQKLLKPVRKNRRGQRERKKIWELKYGGGANHIKKEKEEKQKERERKQLEYEERQRKREEKARQATGGNQAPLGLRKTIRTNGSTIDAPIGPDTTPVIETKSNAVHPSWEAKLKEKEALKNIKFQGKKMKFD